MFIFKGWYNFTIHYDLGGTTCNKITFTEKIETLGNKIEQNKIHYNLDTQTAKILPFPENVGKYQFLTGEHVSPEKGLLENAAAIKKFQYSPFDSELKKTGIAKDQDKLFKDNTKAKDTIKAEDDKIDQCKL